MARSLVVTRRRAGQTIHGKRLSASARAKLEANRYEIKSDLDDFYGALGPFINPGDDTSDA